MSALGLSLSETRADAAFNREPFELPVGISE